MLKPDMTAFFEKKKNLQITLVATTCALQRDSLAKALNNHCVINTMSL